MPPEATTQMLRLFSEAHLSLLRLQPLSWGRHEQCQRQCIGMVALMLLCHQLTAGQVLGLELAQSASKMRWPHIQHW